MDVCCAGVTVTDRHSRQSTELRTSPRPARGRRGAGRGRRWRTSRRSGGQGVGRLDDLQAAGQQVVDRAGRGRRARPKRSPSSSKTSGLSAGRRLRSPPKSSGLLPGPLGRASRGQQHVLGGQLGVVVGRVQVGDAEAGAGAGEGHRPALGLALVDRQLAALGDPAERARRARTRVRLEPPSPEAIRSGLSRAASGAQRAEGVAGGQHPVGLGAAGAGQRRGEARRALLQQGDVPLGVGQHRWRTRPSRSRLTWTWVALRSVIRSSRERQVSSAGSGGKSRPWKRFQAIAVKLARRLVSRELEARFPHRRRAGRVRAGQAARPGAGAESGPARAASAPTRWPAAASPSSSRSPRPGRGSPSRSASPSWAATPIVLRGDELQLSRGESIGDTARVLSRYVDAIVIRSGSHEAVAELAAAAEVPVVNGAHPAPPSLPGARRPAHPARALRRPRRASASPTSATATTSPARWRSPGSSPGSRSSSPRRPATSWRRDTARS